MDLSNLKGFLDPHRPDSPQLSDDDLEDELNAILSGKVSHKPKLATTSSAVNAKRVKQNEAKQSKGDRTGRRSDRMNDDLVAHNVLDINRLAVIDDLDNDDDIDDLDEDDPDLLSEINAIASSKATVSRPKNSSRFELPEVDYPTDGRTSGTAPPERPVRPAPNVPDIVGQPLMGLQKMNAIGNQHLMRPLTPQKLVTNEVTKSQNFGQIPIQTKEPEKSTVCPTNKEDITRLVALRDDYKRAALNAKKSGQQSTALSHIKTAKQIEVVIKALEEGQSVDLSQLPPPPPPTSSALSTEKASKAAPEVEVESQNIEMTTDEVKKFFNAPPPPNTVMEALEQRLNKFKSTLEQANSENNTSKARRLGRIVKQYENSIKDVKKGKTVDFDELPTPPGFGPIPVANLVRPAPATLSPGDPQPKRDVANSGPKPAPVAKPQEKSSSSPSPQKPRTGAQVVPIANTTPPKSEQKPALKRASSTANKQLNYLLERRRLFKEAALESKQKGDIQQAKEYLRMAKGFEPLIEATQNGLPIDATSIPTPPQMNDDFVVISHPQTTETDDLEREEMFRKIEVELQNQIEMCKRNKEYFLQLGDISTSSKFEKYANDSRKDLDLLLIRWRNGQKMPNVKHETRTFSVVICNTEVGTNEVSVEVVKAIDIPAKNSVDTYVKLEFPFPNDSRQSGRTKTVKDTINPVFNETLKFDIDRKARQLPRVFKRHPLKLELMSKGGFLRSDSLIGTALIKLVDFETKCTIHETFELTEGRKVVGGRLEVKVKIREPLLAKQVEEVKEKWLSFV